MKIKLQFPNIKFQTQEIEKFTNWNLSPTLQSFGDGAAIGHWKLKKGFTLVEMLIYMGILSIFLVVLTEIFVKTLDVRTESEATSAVVQDGRYILERLKYDVNEATTIISPSTLGIAPSATPLTITIGGASNTYSISNGNLQLSNNSGAFNLNSSESTVTTFNLQRLSNSTGKDNIRITLTVVSKTQRDQGPETRTFQTTIGPR